MCQVYIRQLGRTSSLGILSFICLYWYVFLFHTRYNNCSSCLCEDEILFTFHDKNNTTYKTMKMNNIDPTKQPGWTRVPVTVPIFSKTFAVQHVNLISGVYRQLNINVSTKYPWFCRSYYKYTNLPRFASFFLLQECQKNHVCSVFRKEINGIW
jgi:hypothetical protein